MSKKVYFGAEDSARRVKKVYLGVEGTARRVKRAYLGVEGAARACLVPGDVAYYGAAPELTSAAWLLASAHAGDKLLFAGGAQRWNGSFQSAVTAYDKRLTATAAAALGVARQELWGESVGERAIFAGGNQQNTAYSNVDIYDADLTRASSALSLERSRMAGAKAGEKAVFAGGYANGSKNAVDAFDADLTRTTSALVTARYNNAGASAGQYALFAGGASTIASVEVFDENLTRTAAKDLSLGRYAFNGVAHARHALFVGGWGDAGAVDAYDESLTHKVLPTVALKSHTTGAVLENRAIFHGGRDRNWGMHADTVVYDELLTCTVGPALSSARWGEAAGSVGDYALFAGGGDADAAGSTVDIFTLD